MDDKLEKLLPLVEKVRLLARERTNDLRPEIALIISNKIKSTASIERMLDELLGYIQLGYGREEFMLLNEYYSAIKPNYAWQYAQFYAEADRD